MIGWILRRVREYECVHEWGDPQMIMAVNAVGRGGGHAAATSIKKVCICPKCLAKRKIKL
jgi:hypothetical protein